MAIGTAGITLYRGENVELAFTMSPVVDITGWTLVLTVKGMDLPLTIPAVIVSAAGGQFKFTLTATDTDVQPSTYLYDVWRTDAGAERIVAIGQFIVKAAART